ncbi:protogloblin ApPgb [Mycobacterium sp. 852013-51886_SCH5428379]|uniref:protoglobin domain-containing protein n=1 Tax=Mycobacterium sp. 852013-51886_SCH5428379 TaxID=1834111 RepID=UPI0007FC5BD4|nr:protoglobin domain-containing protein [Mycobacterium sp. 852013-51886_SCH5428379]OBB58708.1 protogloblin ApPgb [Mycobacterium sp. 852013-51886_SCH5428379]
MTPTIPGYTYDDPAADPSPVSLEDLAELEASVLFGPEDQAAMRTAGSILAPQIEDILDVWYGFVGAHPHLVAYFSTPAGDPLPDYLARVRARFAQWILDTCNRPYDAQWLAYQQEIALRHTALKKNRTDHAESVPLIPLRHLIAFIYPITATVRPFLAVGGRSDDEVDAMYQAWCKAVTLQVALWSQPYAGAAW